MSSETILIVGGGLAGASAAEALRGEGFDGVVRIVGSEAHLPYLRPPLSKGYLLGTEARESVFVKPPEWYADNDIEVETVAGSTVVGLDTAAHRIRLADDRTMPYDTILLATGSSPRRVTVPGADARGIHYLRTIEDSEALHKKFAAGGHTIVFVGAGWIGLEVAAAARATGNSVTMIGREAIPLQGPLGDELGTMFRQLHESNGVVFRLPSDLVSFTEEGGHVTGVVTDSGVLPADLVVVGVGAVPNVELAEKAGLEVQNGILVDEGLRASAPDVYAAGDVANALHPLLGERMRNEHWANALNSGKVAARSMLGQSVVFDEIPYFYTDQYDLGMEYSGYPPLTRGASIVYRGDRKKREFVAFWMQGARVVAGMNVNIWDVNEAVQKLIRSGADIDVARLTDPAVPLDGLA